MDAAAPEAAEPEEKAVPRKRAWWRVKIPTSIIVTLVGIALTAWLLPAFTRQWDDRQKAHELKAALVSEMAAATANAISDSEQLRTSGDRARRAQAVRTWSRASLQMEARLRAYFSPEIANTWSLFSYGIGRLLDAHDVVSAESLGYAVGAAMTRPGLAAEDTVEGVVMELLILDKSSKRQTLTASERQDLHLLSRALGTILTPNFGDRRSPARAFSDAALELRELELELDARILSAHIDGYSTTTRDLINDLLPF